MVTLWMGNHRVDQVEDGDLLARLRIATEPLELKDESGNPLGRYLPEPVPSEEQPWDAPITSQELARLRAGPFYTYEEVKQRLGRE